MLDTIKQWHRRRHAPPQAQWPPLSEPSSVVFDPSVHTAAELMAERSSPTRQPQRAA